MRNILNRLLGSSLGSNSWLLVVEIFWGTLHNSALSFNGAYAIRLGASNTEVSLLTSIPALTAMLVVLPSGRFLQARPRRNAWLLSALWLYRVGTLLYVLVPWLDAGRAPLGRAFVLVVIALTLPLHFFNLGFIPFISQAIPVRQRGDTFAARNAVGGLVMAVSNFLFGVWLARVSFPLNYQAMYAFGFVASVLSTYFIRKVHVPEPEPAPAAAALPLGQALRAQWNDLVTAVTRVPGYSQILLNTFLHGMGLWAAGPLYLLYFVRTLGAKEAWLGEFAAASSLMAIVGNIAWRRVIARYGEPRVLKWSIPLLGFYPLLVGSIPSLNAALLIAALNGLYTPAVNLSHFNTLLRLTPAERHHEYTAVYMTLMNIGAFISPLVGVALANRFGFAPVLIGCGLVCIVGSSSFLLWPVYRGERLEADPVVPGEQAS